jgi:hypothetical protein
MPSLAATTSSHDPYPILLTIKIFARPEEFVCDAARDPLRWYCFGCGYAALCTEMVRLAEDGAMFKIARFEKQFRYASGHSEILRIACGRQELTILIQRRS